MKVMDMESAKKLYEILVEKIEASTSTPVTDEHINELIDAKIGAIENGTY